MHEPVEGNTAVHFGTAAAGLPGRLTGTLCQRRSHSAAHRTLPFGTKVLVTHLGNGRSATATVEDRGPFVRGRIIDLSPRLAEHLGMVAQGVAPVAVTPVELAEAPD
jgi:rare lipoprotein A